MQLQRRGKKINTKDVLKQILIKPFKKDMLSLQYEKAKYKIII